MKPDDARFHAEGVCATRVTRVRDGAASLHDDWLADEVPVALEYNGISHAVMLATPLDLEDFAIGFSLSEGIIDSPADIYGIEAVRSSDGVTLKIDMATANFARLKERRRSLAGRTGCGLCGTESLDQAVRSVLPVASGLVVAHAALGRALEELRALQVLKQATGAHHAAAWCNRAGEVLLLREDVGRHNALDKLVGAVAGASVDVALGFVAITSRASVEMVQKAATAGVQLLAAASVPTALAVRSADASQLTLVTSVRGASMNIQTHPGRVTLDHQ